MAAKPKSRKKSVSARRSVDAGDKDKLIIEQKKHIAVLENELRLKQDLSSQDIERERAEDALRINEKFLNNVFNCIQDGVSVLSKDLSIIRYNPTIEKWHGKDLTGKKCYRRFHGREEPCETCPSIRAMREKTMQREVVRDLIGWKELYAYPLVNDEGEVTGTIEQVRDITERKKAEETLRENNRFINTIMGNLPGMVYRRQNVKDWRMEYISSGCSKLTGYKIEDLFNNHKISYGQLIHPDDRERVWEEMQAAVRANKPYTLIYRIITAGQEEKWIQDQGRSIIKNNKISLEGFITDISERKRAEELLRESESNLKRAEEIAMIGNWSWNLVTDHVSWSDGIYLIQGLKPGDVQPSFDLVVSYVHPDDRELFVRSLNATLTENVPHSIDFRILSPNGSSPYVHIQAEVEFAPDGKPVKLFGTMQDITKRKLAEEERERLLAGIDGQRRQLQAVMDAIPAGVVLADATGKLIQVNEYEKKIWGGSIPLADNWMEYGVFKGWWHNTGKPLLAEDWGMTRALTTGETILGEIIDIERFDGTRGTKLQCSAPVMDAQGNITGAVTIDVDITDRIKLEKDLDEARLQAELYLDLMGHDINNLNFAAMGFLELALKTLEAEKKLKLDDKLLIERPLAALQSSSKLIGNVRKLQRLSKEGVNTKAVDLGDVLKEIDVASFNHEGREITVNIPEINGCIVEANELLRDVFLNLITNAVKHSDEDKPLTVDVKVEPVQDNGRMCYRCVVEDNGPGVPDELKPKLFNRLTRGTTKAYGKGLGLYLARTLVEGYGGQMLAEDRVPGDHKKGARFVVMLPATEQ